MKKAMMHLGIIMVVEDDCSTDILMNYALNSLNMKEQISGAVRIVEVRGIDIPTIDQIKDDKEVNLIHRGSDARN